MAPVDARKNGDLSRALVVLPHETQTRGRVQDDMDQRDEVAHDRILGGAAGARDRPHNEALVLRRERSVGALPALDGVRRWGAVGEEVLGLERARGQLARLLFATADALQGGAHQHDEDLSPLLGQAWARTSSGYAFPIPPPDRVRERGLDAVEEVLGFRPTLGAPRHRIDLCL